MKIEARQVESFLKKPDPKVRGVVIYGNDDGLVAERAVTLARSVCEDLKDPFRVVDIAGDVLKQDPARLADEFGALSMMGGRRVIRVRPAGEESVAALENLVEAVAGDALIIVEAGNLTPRSNLRTLAETEASLAALPCYMDNEAALEGLVESAARAQGLSVDPEALDWIVQRLGGDRGQTRGEIDKLLLYKGSDAGKSITLQDAMAVLGDTASIGIDDVIAATFDGEVVALDRALDRVFAEGGNPVQLVRSLQRHADQLHLVSGHVAKGLNLEGALFKARGLPRGGPVRQRFERHLRTWPLPRLNAAVSTILDAEIDCKRTGLPHEAIARRLCLRLSQAARSAKARR
ncbi:DNA polymerase III subunit delta [Reyranella sp.]|uniref:DNA polymerase III subunit delta n=1 Tax=Reyranella sp. TaxID=1929291 RepID=UPI000BCD067E|nr:DNA polymerase III subunit delta [Reyranella sp.]OYY43075.1 MAG: DNA polymerase III subunit delta [Rhodospirillales bacterium 35-66-84]OYZ95044.1 MAG: DNA polymerase III subunit delta [Rhodospirillales bacterium 24-66-33]OZB26484.1 MAG: DNA polymerase III subunit delta [Rhodospirillales bacterium 39-66-50]HQS15892.1 DNA polymerase III subunit delta [Reyranella sp.]HQT13158.1 DNA polymerase III subunit delta [Reyranella sp.]